MNVLDLWDDADMNAVSKEDYKLYMYDGIHPSRAGTCYGGHQSLKKSFLKW
ncbi:hypothetical protein GCWU000342_02044 [Shuttleworthella satelles DSM 14600]|uniref:Uncharacterized protein n=1 Tax=Shuttleworthella satelles DSM 14600 TaxID=626523 RepID=C4GE98_9FIRM|nr:hypothetical protein GCWU000342_02044 [Shuttleworthia satelles DSM 14600]